MASHGKLVAGTAMTMLAGACTTVIISILGRMDPGFSITTDLQGAIHTILTAILSGGAIYLTPSSEA